MPSILCKERYRPLGSLLDSWLFEHNILIRYVVLVLIQSLVRAMILSQLLFLRLLFGRSFVCVALLSIDQIFPGFVAALLARLFIRS